MKPGDMLKKLHATLASLKPLMLEGPEAWQSLDIDYEAPRVERLWRQVDDVRVFLHQIHPCAQALYHPHPWPSAVHLLFGKYEMGVAESATILFPNLIEADREVARVVLAEGSEYEMLNPTGWHYVKPLGRVPSLSIMVTAKPWDPPVFDHGDFGKKVELKPLPYDVKRGILDNFLLGWGL